MEIAPAVPTLVMMFPHFLQNTQERLTSAITLVPSAWCCTAPGSKWASILRHDTNKRVGETQAWSHFTLDIPPRRPIQEVAGPPKFLFPIIPLPSSPVGLDHGNSVVTKLTWPAFCETAETVETEKIPDSERLHQARSLLPLRSYTKGATFTFPGFPGEGEHSICVCIHASI